MTTKQARKAKKARKAQKAKRAKTNSSALDAELPPATTKTAPLSRLLDTTFRKAPELLNPIKLRLTTLIQALKTCFVRQSIELIPKTPKQLLDLPAEIRLEIYDWYFASIPYESYKGGDSPDQSPKRVTPLESFRPALLHVDHQVCQEALKPYLARLELAWATVGVQVEELAQKRRTTDHGNTIDGSRARLAEMQAIDRMSRLRTLLREEMIEAMIMLELRVVGTGRIPSHNPAKVEAVFEQFQSFMNERRPQTGIEGGHAVRAFCREHGLDANDAADLITMTSERLLSAK